MAHSDAAIREFWIEHGIRCRHIGAEMGRQLGTATVTNVWIPDGYKDIPIDRTAPRQRLEESLDRIFQEQIDPRLHLDAVEAKLFGIGAESYTVGSIEFYMGYAVSREQAPNARRRPLSHPTEKISEKISLQVLLFCPGLLLHVSRPVRWDSDHVVILDDELQAIATEIVRSGKTDRIHIGLDYFDASINRVAAWVIGTRNMIKALLMGLLEPDRQTARVGTRRWTSRKGWQCSRNWKSLPLGSGVGLLLRPEERARGDGVAGGCPLARKRSPLARFRLNRKRGNQVVCLIRGTCETIFAGHPHDSSRHGMRPAQAQQSSNPCAPGSFNPAACKNRCGKRNDIAKAELPWIPQHYQTYPYYQGMQRAYVAAGGTVFPASSTCVISHGGSHGGFGAHGAAAQAHS